MKQSGDFATIGEKYYLVEEEQHGISQTLDFPMCLQSHLVSWAEYFRYH